MHMIIQSSLPLHHENNHADSLIVTSWSVLYQKVDNEKVVEASTENHSYKQVPFCQQYANCVLIQISVVICVVSLMILNRWSTDCIFTRIKCSRLAFHFVAGHAWSAEVIFSVSWLFIVQILTGCKLLQITLLSPPNLKINICKNTTLLMSLSLLQFNVFLVTWKWWVASKGKAGANCLNWW